MQNLYDEKEFLCNKNAIDKVICFVLRQYISNGCKKILKLDYSKKLLSEQLDISPETLSRVFNTIRNKYNVNILEKEITVENLEPLVKNTCKHCVKNFPCM